jgi:hypothetical protein
MGQSDVRHMLWQNVPLILKKWFQDVPSLGSGDEKMTSEGVSLWFARLVLAAVFVLNVTCAVAFIVKPDAYAPSFEVSGVSGTALIRGMGVLFLMWNVTYPLALWHPWRYRWLFLIIILQQAIGVVGETWMLIALPGGHETLAHSALRFIVFDGAGLFIFLIAFTTMWLARARPPHSEKGNEGTVE